MSDHWLGWTGSLGYLPAVGASGLALGAGARLAKGVFDDLRGEEDEDITLPAPASNIERVPVKVTPEEAAELRRQGVRVREVLQKRSSSPGFFTGIAHGALGAGTALGGWALIDKLYGRGERDASKARLDKARARLRALIDDSPEEEDAAIYSQLKVAEEKHIRKEAADFGTLKAVGGLSIGAGAMLAALQGYRTSKEVDPGWHKAKLLRQYLRQRPATTPMLTSEPYVVQGEETEDDEKLKRLRRALASRPVARPAPVAPRTVGVPTLIIEAAGAPSQQAKEAPRPVVVSPAPAKPASSSAWI